jgi:hypothetical protein
VRYYILAASWANFTESPEAVVLKKLGLAGLAKLTKFRFVLSRLLWTRESTLGRCTQPANSQLIPRSMMKYLGLARLA